MVTGVWQARSLFDFDRFAILRSSRNNDLAAAGGLGRKAEINRKSSP
jgi:hypothetical protein